uniref:Uncharacterized protein n=1 Tax=Xiphophorus maculatus TaxID=8083 RepID=A0A3B5QUT8_XIPMA
LFILYLIFPSGSFPLFIHLLNRDKKWDSRRENENERKQETGICTFKCMKPYRVEGKESTRT